MNGTYGYTEEKNIKKKKDPYIEYDSLKYDDYYDLSYRRKSYDDLYSDYNHDENNPREARKISTHLNHHTEKIYHKHTTRYHYSIYENFDDGPQVKKTINFHRESDYIDHKKESYLISDMLHGDISGRLDQPLIETYHDINELDVKTLCEISIKLGCISFGGPLVHQELIKSKFTRENKFMTEKHFNQILNLCLVLPGYSSSTLLSAIVAVKTRSMLGGLLALILFNIPSLIAVLICSIIIKTLKKEIHSGIPDYKTDKSYFSSSSHPFFFVIMILSSGLIQAALGLMIHTAYLLCKKLSYSTFQFIILLSAGVIYYFIPDYTLMVIIIIVSGLFSSIKGDHDYLLDQSDVIGFDYKISKIKFIGLPCLILFFLIFGLINIFDFLAKNIYFFLFENFFRIGTLSFGEGHVIIPMILTEFQNQDLLEEAEILNGYALVSLLPGSMFNMAAYSGVTCSNILGGVISNIAIFLPGFLFVFTALPFIDKIKSSNFFQFFIRGANSAAIGFVFTAAIKLWIDSCFVNPYSNPITGTLNVLICYILAEAFKVHKPYVIIFGATFMLVLTYTKIFLQNEENLIG